MIVGSRPERSYTLLVKATEPPGDAECPPPSAASKALGAATGTLGAVGLLVLSVFLHSCWSAPLLERAEGYDAAANWLGTIAAAPFGFAALVFVIVGVRQFRRGTLSQDGVVAGCLSALFVLFAFVAHRVRRDDADLEFLFLTFLDREIVSLRYMSPLLVAHALWTMVQWRAERGGGPRKSTESVPGKRKSKSQTTRRRKRASGNDDRSTWRWWA